MKTVNRGWLKRRVAEGKVEAKCNYHLTDDYAHDNATGFGKTSWMPCRIKLHHEDFVEGVINFTEGDFRTKSGGAYKVDDSDEIRFRIHSNESYTLRIKEAADD